MQDYNTLLPNIKLPEYGRNVQNLIDYCMTIEDRKKRTACAYQIVNIMGDLYPEINQVENAKQILWDHLSIMSDFKLDVDYPVTVINREHINTPPNPIEYQNKRIHYRMYGKVVEDMIHKACELEDQAQRIRLFELCANHMKLNFHQTNPSADEDDDKIIQDLLEYSNGQYKEEIYQVFLYSAEELKVNKQYDPAKTNTTSAKKKKKKKKKQ